MNINFTKYSFVVPIDSSVSISTFWFEVNENNGTQPTLYKNGGSGYQVQQDQLIFAPAMGNVTLTTNPVARGGGDIGNLTYTRTYSLVAGVCTQNLISLQIYSQYTDSRRTQSFTGLHECIWQCYPSLCIRSQPNGPDVAGQFPVTCRRVQVLHWDGIWHWPATDRWYLCRVERDTVYVRFSANFYSGKHTHPHPNKRYQFEHDPLINREWSRGTARFKPHGSAFYRCRTGPFHHHVSPLLTDHFIPFLFFIKILYGFILFLSPEEDLFWLYLGILVDIPNFFRFFPFGG